jgi:nicotinate-nucleotide pyrophosphorylase (carboxylating)
LATKSGLSRQDRLKRALFRGESLTMKNAEYRAAVEAFCDLLLKADQDAKDLTIEALGIGRHVASARVLARERGTLAGLEEFAWLYGRAGLEVQLAKHDGEAVEAGNAIAEIGGEARALLSLERVGLNLIQRMSGIATATRRLQEIVRRHSNSAFVVATRKTHWGPLDKRAVHLGGGGTHRLTLGDAIIIKNNHLRLFGATEQEAVPKALEQVWLQRKGAAFVEVEVRSPEAAIAAARAFERLAGEESKFFPCLVMLDNFSAQEAGQTVRALHLGSLWDSVLVESSGGITEAAIGEYAASGVDAISIGALTHSARAMDLSQTFD